jgi:hypothetical protein
MGSEPFTTYSGIAFDPTNPTPEMIDIKDVAHALSRICRFGGHMHAPKGSAGMYTVAQHSTFVADFCPPELKLTGLLHDAAEAYIGDIITPVKYLFGMSYYRDIELRILRWAIEPKFGIALTPKPDEVHEMDLRLRVTEALCFMPQASPLQYEGIEPLGGWDNPIIIKPLPPRQAEKKFLRYFRYLTSDTFQEWLKGGRGSETS